MPLRVDASQFPSTFLMVKNSLSPVNSAANIAAESRKQSYASSPTTRPTPTSPAGSGLSHRTTIRASNDRDRSNSITSPPTPSFSLISASDSDGLNDREGSFWNLSRWRSTRQSLRHSSVLSSPNGSPNPSHTRSGSDFLSVKDRSSLRMSLGINDSKPSREEIANRRRSAGPRLTSRLSVQGDNKIGVEEEVDTPEQVTPTKKRVDSGVGRISDESATSVVQPQY